MLLLIVKYFLLIYIIIFFSKAYCLSVVISIALIIFLTNLIVLLSPLRTQPHWPRLCLIFNLSMFGINKTRAGPCLLGQIVIALRLLGSIVFFVVKSLFSTIFSCENLPCVLSDHDFVKLSVLLEGVVKRGSGVWHLNNSLLSDPDLRVLYIV